MAFLVANALTPHLLRRYFVARRAAGYYARNVLLIGLPHTLRQVAGYFAEHISAADYRVVGRLSIEEGSAPRQSETPYYHWRVVGYKGQVFTGYKFTTMVADAERRQTELLPLNEMTGPVFKISNDPRVTQRKLTARPGITCLWQVRGRNRISNFDDWVRMDLEYIDNWSQ